MRALYTAASGMNAQQLRIDNIANNLANISTTGFKKSRESFEDLIYQQYPVSAPSQLNPRPAPLEVGTGVRLVATQRDFRTGDLSYTGNELDVAIGGRGFFLVTDFNGVQRFTRDGRFTRNAEGEVVNSQGMSLNPPLFVPEDTERVLIAQDGTITVERANGTQAVTVGQLQLVEFMNPTGLRSVGGNLFEQTAESGQPMFMAPNDGFVNVQQGFIESSNVDVAEELVGMIVAQRAFELTSKVVTTADEMLQTVSGLKR
jgi:flagellar basal-body rod protein FlgG